MTDLTEAEILALAIANEATAIAGMIFACALVMIAGVRWRYMETPFISAIVQIVIGGLAVLDVGILIGSS